MTVKVVRPAPERSSFTQTRQPEPANHLGYAGDEDEQFSAETGAPVQYVEGEAPLLGEEELETPWKADAEAREIEDAPTPAPKARKPRAKAAPKAKVAPAVETAPKRGPGRPRLSPEQKAANALARKEAKKALKIDPTIAAAAVAKPKPRRATNNDGTPNKRGRKTKAESPESWAFLENRPPRTAINIRLETSVIEWFKKAGTGYQTRINEALKTFIEACQNGTPATA